VAWALVIFFASTSWGSGEHTGAFLMPLLRWLFPSADYATLEAMHLVLRKIGHFAEYLVLGLLLLRALRADAPWSARYALLATALATLYAASDEIHQCFVAGRVAAVGDVLIDTAGAATGQVLVAVRRLLAR
jgi:VanZ family protein